MHMLYGLLTEPEGLAAKETIAARSELQLDEVPRRDPRHAEADHVRKGRGNVRFSRDAKKDPRGQAAPSTTDGAQLHRDRASAARRHATGEGPRDRNCSRNRTRPPTTRRQRGSKPRNKLDKPSSQPCARPRSRRDRHASRAVTMPVSIGVSTSSTTSGSRSGAKKPARLEHDETVQRALHRLRCYSFGITCPEDARIHRPPSSSNEYVERVTAFVEARRHGNRYPPRDALPNITAYRRGLARAFARYASPSAARSGERVVR